MQANDYADLYAIEDSMWWFVGMRDITAALLDPICQSGTDRLILDAGCGTGVNLLWLKRYSGHGQVIGLDLVEDAIRFCRSRGHKNLVQASVTDIPFADETFDLLTSFDVLVQVEGEGSDQQALGEMFRVMRKGGIAFVRVAAYEWMRSGHDEALGTQRRYELGQLVDRMESAGFRVLRTTYANSLLLPVAVLRRLLLKRIGLASRGSDVKPLPPALDRLNRMLAGLLRREAQWLRNPKTRLRGGLSAICVAEKPRR